MNARTEQRAVCNRFGSPFIESREAEKLGIAIATLAQLPLNGLRVEVEGGTCGWYVWGGEGMSEADDFFLPLHVEHLAERCPEIIPYLGLAPGWRFIIAPGYEDVWYDESLLVAAP